MKIIDVKDIHSISGGDGVQASVGGAATAVGAIVADIALVGGSYPATMGGAAMFAAGTLGVVVLAGAAIGLVGYGIYQMTK